MTPVRIQRKRTKGWRMPEGAIYVGRPSYWGNPYRPGDPDPLDPDWPMRRDRAVDLFQTYVERKVGYSGFAMTVDIRADLAGHDLVCWCPLDAACHADVLLEIANGGER